MPVEAIHISAFLDSLARSEVPPSFRQGPLRELGRLGCLVIDFPYFEHFPLGVARYLLKRPTATSAWGAALHLTTPVAVAHELLEHVRRLRARPSSREQAEQVLALCLGYVSHLAIDRALHPLVNQLARERAQKVGGDPARHHTDVEKYHSVLFHEARLGFDFMGRRELGQHIAVDADAVHREPHLAQAFHAGLARALGKAPSWDELRGWSKGYRQYVALVSSPLGKLLAPEPDKQRMRGEVYGGSWGTFPERYEASLEGSQRAIEAALGWAEDESQAAAFSRVLPEGPIDLD
ncbi:MAG: hypothetical protein QM778_07860 [Myxococcales bacterium]